jgi:hypothetical protein
MSDSSLLHQGSRKLTSHDSNRQPKINITTSGFLEDIDGMTRNSLLAWHETHSKRIKHDIVKSELRQKIKQRHEEEATTTLCLQQLRQHTQQCPIIGGMPCVFATKSNVSTLRSSLSSDLKSDSSKSRPPEATQSKQHHTQINEPHVLRMSVYQKLAVHLQHFYNEQDILSLQSLILHPLCEPMVTKTKIFWEHDDNHIQDGAQRKCSMLHSVAFKGLTAINNACSHMFEKLPDNVIICHENLIVVRDSHDFDAEDNPSKRRKVPPPLTSERCRRQTAIFILFSNARFVWPININNFNNFNSFSERRSHFNFECSR